MIVLAGMPGSGKDTQAALLEARDGFHCIAAGSLLRSLAPSDPAIAAALASGELVPTSVMTPLLESALPDDHSKIILDGVPREPAQASWLTQWLKSHQSGVSLCIELVISEAESLQRSLGRGRKDDTESVLRSRLSTYKTVTQPALALLSPPMVACQVEASADPESVYKTLRDTLVDQGVL